MNQKLLLIIANVLYLIPIFGLFGFVISVMASGYRSKHIQLIKAFVLYTLLEFLWFYFYFHFYRDHEIWWGGVVAELIRIIFWITIISFYSYMVIQLLRVFKVKGEW